MGKWRGWLKRFEQTALTAWYALRDPRVPLLAKLVQLAGVVYLFLPLDLIPDVIPIIGMLDDAAILPLVTYAFFRMMPQNVLGELRGRADAKVDKWGGIILWGGIAFIVLWIVLAGWGGYKLITREAAQPIPYSVPSSQIPPST